MIDVEHGLGPFYGEDGIVLKGFEGKKTPEKNMTCFICGFKYLEIRLAPGCPACRKSDQELALYSQKWAKAEKSVDAAWEKNR